MMGLLSLITGGAVSAIGDTIKKFVTTDEDRLKAAAEIETILQRRDSEIEQTIRSEVAASQAVMVAEMQQGDTFTKRARPTLVYFGLLVTFWNYCLMPAVAFAFTRTLPTMNLPDAFWAAWGTTVSVWSLGRSFERRGVGGPLVGKIVGK